MNKKNNPKFSAITRLLCGIILCVICLTATSCAYWYNLWERYEQVDPNPDDLLIPDGNTAEGDPADTEVSFENVVEYNGKAHEGVEICYVGQDKNKKQTVIVIDPGHQAEGNSELEPLGPGSDEQKQKVTWGASGTENKYEHELNLAVALLLRDELYKRGYSIVMIRETAEVNISNKERAMIANKYNAAVFIRIHANSQESNPKMKGAMVFCQTDKNPYPACAAHYEESLLLSETVLEAYCKETGMEKNELRESDDYTGTNWSEVPTTILEMGFLSNRSDDMMMKLNTFRKKAAIGIANGIEYYLEIMQERAEALSDTDDAAELSDSVTSEP